MRTQIEWTTFTMKYPFQKYLSLRPFVLWLNGWRMDRYISEQIDTHLASTDASSASNPSIIDILVEDRYAGEDALTSAASIKEMKSILIPQVRAFLFGGHDTTSSTLLYCYHVLEEHPGVLSRVLAEHDQVFGADASECQAIINKDPYILNKIPYTTAVIKEVLRLFPPAASMRIGRPGAVIHDEQGREYPIEGCNVWTLTHAIHHNPRFWPEPEAFIPERWLVDEHHHLHPVKGAWRPFQHGPKNCLGQPLAMLELKICLVMTLRELSITSAYEAWDEMHPRKGIKTTFGNRAYQAEKGGGGAHPADGFPVTLTRRR